MTVRQIVFVVLVLCCPQTFAAEAPKNILFVGNSFTYYNNGLHSHYRELLRAGDGSSKRPGVLRSLTISGGRLPEHASGLGQMLANHSWDVVVLQGYSNGPIGSDTAAPFQKAARDYAAAIRAHGAEPVFFMTWAYTDKPEMTGQLAAAYTAIGKELSAKVVPVGLAFAKALQVRNDLKLVVADRKHPTQAGTYLAACTFYAALEGRSPEGLKYTAGFAPRDAKFLQQTAWASWQAYNVLDD